MALKNLLFSISFLLISSFIYAQNGLIIGKVSDAASGETIPGVKISLEGASKGAMSDLDGVFVIRDVVPGSYSVICVYNGYNTKILTDIKVAAGETTNFLVGLDKVVKEIGMVTVKVTVNKESNTNLLQLQKNSVTTLDGVSAETIKKSPDRSASDALKRVSGASIQDNKFAVIRGLNDRYNAAFLNGSPLPSSESDRKAFAFDIFPVNMLDNLTIIKTASPELPADFAGGIIQIKTKDIPEKNFQSFTLGSGYNTITTFKDQVTYPGGKTDWIGVDDGARAIPSVIPDKATMAAMLMSDQAELAKAFTTDWRLQSQKFMPNLNFQYSGGLNSTIKGRQIGFIGSLSYSKNNNYNETQRRSYAENNSGSNAASLIENDLLDKIYSTQILAGSMANFSLKLNSRSNIGFKNLYSINSDNRVIARTGELSPTDNNPILLKSNARWFTGNNIYSGQLTGDHLSKNSKLRFDWVGGYSNIQRTIPNLRRSIYTRMKYLSDPNDPNPYDTIYTANIAAANVGPDYGGGMFFSTNTESIYNLKANLNVKLDTIANISSDLKFGGLIQYRQREFAARQLGYTRYGVAGGNVSFDQSLLYQPEDSIFMNQNMGLLKPGVGGFKLSDGSKPSDEYSANSKIIAGFVSLDNKIKDKIRLNWGARAEYFVQNLSALKSDYSTLSLSTSKLDVLPSFNFIYSPNAKQNFRLSGSQTLNRPEYRELAPFAFYDFNTQFVLSGNDSLQRSKITNADFRYEWYPGKNQMLSSSIFYKHFQNPIEQIMRSDVLNEISYSNVPVAVNYGIELEFRSVIGSLINADSSSFLNNLNIFSNLSVIRSKVDVSNTGTIYSSRPLQGQSPYVFNGGINYQNKKHKLSYALNVNRVGQRLYIVGSLLQRDIWEKSRTFLDFQIAKQSKNEKFEIKLNIQNILAQKLVFYQNNYGNEETVKGFNKVTNSLFLGDGQNSNGYNEKVDDAMWTTTFGQTFSFVLTYKL